MKFAVLCALFIFSNASAQPVNLTESDALKKPITLRATYLSLDELLSEINRQTGAALSVDRAVADDKAHCFIKERPAGEMLTQLAALLFLEWRRQPEGGFRLGRSAQARDYEIKLAEETQKAFYRELESILTRWTRIAEQDYNRLSQEKSSIEQEMERLASEQPIGWELRRNELGRKLSAQGHGDLLSWLGGAVYRQVPSDQRKRFMAGEPLIASTRPGTPLRLPSQLFEWLQPAIGDISVNDTVEYLYQIRLEPQRFQLRCQLFAKNAQNQLTLHTSGSYPLSPLPVTLKDHPIRKQMLTWQSKSISPSQELQTPLKRPQPLNDSRARFLGEWLAFLSDRCDMNIIAPAFRQTVSNEPLALPLQARNLEDALSMLPISEVSYRLSGNYLCLQYTAYWEQRWREIPERLIKPLEQKYRREGLMPDDYAQLIFDLTPLQQASLRGSEAKAIQFPCVNLPVDALLFWATLFPPQKIESLNRKPIPYDTMNAEQRRAFQRASQSQMESGFWIDFDSPPNDLAFFLEQDHALIMRHTEDNLTIDRTPGVMPPDESQTSVKSQGSARRLSLTFHFGFSVSESVTYSWQWLNPVPEEKP